MSKIVGATSARAPGSPETSIPPFSPVTMNGTGSSVSADHHYLEWSLELTGSVGSVGVTSNRVQHLLGISVIGSNAKNVASLFTCVVNSLDSLVGSSNSNNSSVVITSMTNHVGRSKVAHDEFVFARFDNFGDLVGDTLDAHLGLLVVSSDLGRGDHVSFLALELLLDTSIEEEGDVGVFLGFCWLAGFMTNYASVDLPAM